MGWTIKFSDRADRSLAKLESAVAKRITSYLRERVLTSLDPRLIGEPLVGNFQGYWRYRVGDYRIVCEFQDRELIIMVVTIGHRKEIYH